MGHGIAQVAAVAGFRVSLTDARAAALDAARAHISKNLDGAVQRAKLSREAADSALLRITTTPDLGAAIQDAQVVVEAVVEDLDVKRAIFADIDAVAPPDVILASNTSSLSVGAIADATRTPSRVVGLHFFNPVHIMKLVEVIAHRRSDPSSVSAAADFARQLGKTAIVVRDSPGFASSRLGVVLGLEAMRMV